MADADLLLVKLSEYKTLDAEKIDVKSTSDMGELVKVYINNVFAGIASVESTKGDIQIPQHQIDSMRVLTSKTEDELLKVFDQVVNLGQEQKTGKIDEKFSSICLFIEQITANPRLRPHITHCDVENLIDQISKLEKMSTTPELKSRLTQYKSIIAAFKIDKVISQKPLERNNEYNIRYYNDKWQDGFRTYEKLQQMLNHSEEGPLKIQLEDLSKTGKIHKEDGVALKDLNHGDLVCFETLKRHISGEKAITFAVVDKLGEETELRIPNEGKQFLFIPKEQMTFTRITPATN